MEKKMSHAKTLTNSNGPVEGQGIPDAAAKQRLDQTLLKAITKNAEKSMSTTSKHHELSIYSTMVG